MRFSAILPFFAILALAAWFFYFQWSAAKFRHIDFGKTALYGKDYIFQPSKNEYLVVFYHSKSSDLKSVSTAVFSDFGETHPLIAIDFYQDVNSQNVDSQGEVIALSAGMETLLKLAQDFKITKIPAYFKIKRERDARFAQSGVVRVIKHTQLQHLKDKNAKN